MKGTKTVDLFKSQYRNTRERETPIKQTWDYMGQNNLDYCVCSNYKDFVLITKAEEYRKYYSFDFTLLEHDMSKLKEFIGIFSKARVIDNGFVKNLWSE